MSDQTVYAQFRPDGFTLNNRKTYMGGDQLIDKALTHVGAVYRSGQGLNSCRA